MILSGKETAAALDEKNAALCEKLKAKGVLPCLAIVRIGEKDGDISYERGASKRCEKLGIEVRHHVLPEESSEADVLTLVEKLNRDDAVHGVLLLRPFPSHMRDDAIRQALSADKDVDGITDGSLAGVFTGTEKGFAPCTAEACMKILEHFEIDPAGKRAVVVGRSLVVGRPAAMLLMHRNATVTLCHTRTVDLPARCREAEILLVAAGRMGSVGKDNLSNGQIVLDVGIHMGGDGRLCGDVDRAALEAADVSYTPVPGGVGAVTNAVLAGHVLEAARRKAGE